MDYAPEPRLATYNEIVAAYGEDYMELWCALLAPCPACGGDGGGEATPTVPHDTGRWIECQHCGGTGSVATEPAGIEHTED